MNMIDHETMQIKVRIAFLRNPEISVEQHLMPKNIMNISNYLMIFNSIRSKKFQGSALFYCFNCDNGNDGNHNLFLLIVVATGTIEQFDLIK